jgi:YjbE family integral membrane protein
VFEMFFQPSFWVALAQIIGVNIVLSGDNAVVIAMACRSLSPAQQRKGIIYGSAGAIVLRIILTFFAVGLLQAPYLKLIGAALLVWIGIKLLLTEDESEGSGIESYAELSAAIKTIITADVVMSLDNVIGVAAAAKGDIPLMVIGLLISIPLIIFGSAFIMRLMDRFPIIITGGGALLGYVAGEMVVTDISIKAWVDQNMQWAHYVVPISLAVLVVIAGKWLNLRASTRFAEGKLDDLVEVPVSPVKPED